jgi:hypothetical protein
MEDLINPYTEAKSPIHSIIDTLPNKAQAIFWRIWSAFEEGHNEGAQACIKALLKWLMEPCTEHPLPDDFIKGHKGFATGLIKWNGISWDYSHRKDCPLCMEEAKEKYGCK